MSQRYIGIDAHASSCTIAVLGPTGKRIRQWQVETQRAALIEAVRSVAAPRYICFEEGTLSEWLYEVLESLAADVKVIQPLRNTGVKNDIKDAWAAAEAMRLQRKDVVCVFKAPTMFTALRKAVRTHSQIQQDLVRCKNRIHANYRARGLRVDSGIYDSRERQSWIKKLNGPHRQMVEHFYVELDALVPTFQQAEQWLLKEAERVPLVEMLATAPGIGTLRASQIVATVLSPRRFRTSRQFWSYCGLGVVMRSSADWIKNVFKGAAFTIASSRMASHPLHQAYQRLLASNTKPNLARLTIARRVAAAVLAMWKNKESYDPNKQLQTT
jgi:transposase